MPALDAKDFARLLSMIAAAVATRGGHVEIPFAAIPPLLLCGFRVCKKDEESITFVMDAPDGKKRHPSEYKDRAFYRAEVVMKYLISTSPEGQLSITAKSITDLGKFTLGFNAQGGCLKAIVNKKVEAGTEGDRTFVVKKDGIPKYVPLQTSNVMA